LPSAVSRTRSRGEIAKAYVVLKPGATADAEDIIALCRKELAGYKVLRAVQFVSDLPKTSTGKIMRRELRKLDVEAAPTTRVVAAADA
jgi:long-chain acyl-CoA synthetase